MLFRSVKHLRANITCIKHHFNCTAFFWLGNIILFVAMIALAQGLAAIAPTLVATWAFRWL